MGGSGRALTSVHSTEKRKAWLYETPLSAQHALRAALSDPNTLDPALVEKFDLPVVAAVTKLWLLELDGALDALTAPGRS